jgi:hypothetical protein
MLNKAKGVGMSRKGYHGHECSCDKCRAGYNAAAHAFLAASKQGKRYGETDESYTSRLTKTSTKAMWTAMRRAQ